jgi:hypothetical protein
MVTTLQCLPMDRQVLVRHTPCKATQRTNRIWAWDLGPFTRSSSISKSLKPWKKKRNREISAVKNLRAQRMRKSKKNQRRKKQKKLKLLWSERTLELPQLQFKSQFSCQSAKFTMRMSPTYSLMSKEPKL